jgi:hypothetical protein
MVNRRVMYGTRWERAECPDDFSECAGRLVPRWLNAPYLPSPSACDPAVTVSTA